MSAAQVAGNTPRVSQTEPCWPACRGSSLVCIPTGSIANCYLYSDDTKTEQEAEEQCIVEIWHPNILSSISTSLWTPLSVSLNFSLRTALVYGAPANRTASRARVQDLHHRRLNTLDTIKRTR